MSQIKQYKLENGQRLMQLGHVWLEKGEGIQQELTDGFGLYEEREDGYWHRIDSEVYSVS